MARTNRYTSINFNDIYEKKATNNNNTRPSPSSSSSFSSATSSSSFSHQTSSTHLSTSRIHGRMLVLTRPSPSKPQPQPQPSIPSAPLTPKSAPGPDPDHNRLESDSISLRPLGRTGSSLSSPPVSSPVTQERDREREAPFSPKPEPFVPPHLRPGFVGREERFQVQNGHRHQGFRSREFGQAAYGEDGRPKSGGYERNRVGVDLGEMNRPSSSGNRSGSNGGWYGSSYRSPPHY